MDREGYRVTTEYEARHWWFRARRELFLSQVARAATEQGFPTRPLRLLDYGCGSGFNLAFLSEFGHVAGADVPSSPFDEARRRTGRPLFEIEPNLSERAGKFEIITALDVLEHLDDDAGGLRQVESLLSEAGQVVLTVPAYPWLWSGEDVISHHRRRYTRRTLLEVCRRAGFAVAFWSYFNLALLPGMAGVVWARRLLLDRAARRSNLELGTGVLGLVAGACSSLEARWVGSERVRLPAGASLVCRLVKSAGGRA